MSEIKELMEVLTRTCNDCEKDKPLEDFHKCKVFPLGRTYTCKDCANRRAREWNAANKERKKQTNKAHYENNKGPYLERGRNSTWAKNNRERVRELSRLNYRLNNGAAKSAMSHRTRRVAAPPWLTEDHKKEIEGFYWLAKDLKAVSGQDYHVDHIIPIKGKTICGLHVPWNLQVLPSDVNISKGNRY